MRPLSISLDYMNFELILSITITSSIFPEFSSEMMRNLYCMISYVTYTISILACNSYLSNSKKVKKFNFSFIYHEKCEIDHIHCVLFYSVFNIFVLILESNTYIYIKSCILFFQLSLL